MKAADKWHYYEKVKCGTHEMQGIWYATRKKMYNQMHYGIIS